jgi:hypothetical protein
MDGTACVAEYVRNVRGLQGVRACFKCSNTLLIHFSMLQSREKYSRLTGNGERKVFVASCVALASRREALSTPT